MTKIYLKLKNLPKIEVFFSSLFILDQQAKL